MQTRIIITEKKIEIVERKLYIGDEPLMRDVRMIISQGVILPEPIEPIIEVPMLDLCEHVNQYCRAHDAEGGTRP